MTVRLRRAAPFVFLLLGTLTVLPLLADPAAPAPPDHAAQIAAETAAIDKEPNRADLYLQRGRTHAELVQTGILGLPEYPEADAARADYDKALALDPDLAEAYAWRALLHDDLDLTKTDPGSELSLARTDADKAVALAPHDAVVYLCRGRLRQNAVQNTNLNHMFDQTLPEAVIEEAAKLALADLNQALALDPKVPGGYRERARIRGWKGNDAAGEQADLEQAVAQEPSDAETLVTLVNVAFSRADWPAARKAVDALLVLRPDLGDAYATRSQIRAQQADLDGALADASHAVDLDAARGGPSLANALLQRGVVYTTQKKYDLAEADEVKATETDPKNVAAWDALARLQADGGRFDDGIATLRRGLTTNAASPGLHLTLGLLLALKDDVPGAQAEYAAGLPTALAADVAAQTTLVQALLKSRPDSAGLKAALAALQAAPAKQ